MLLRVGGLCVVSGLTLALVLGSSFALAGGVLIFCGGIALALAIEPLVADEHLEPEVAPPPRDSEHGDVAA